MRVEYIGQIGTWQDVWDAAMTTCGGKKGEPTDEWIRKMVLAEHSPIRLVSFRWKWIDLPYWVSVHFCRHKIGIEHFVRSQRKNENRGDEPQGALVEHECVANVQGIINISRKRQCNRAALETWDAWLDVLRCLPPVIESVCVSECVYRGFCPEMKTCGYATSEFFAPRVAKYRGGKPV